MFLWGGIGVIFGLEEVGNTVGNKGREHDKSVNRVHSRKVGNMTLMNNQGHLYGEAIPRHRRG